MKCLVYWDSLFFQPLVLLSLLPHVLLPILISPFLPTFLLSLYLQPLPTFLLSLYLQPLPTYLLPNIPQPFLPTFYPYIPLSLCYWQYVKLSCILGQVACSVRKLYLIFQQEQKQGVPILHVNCLFQVKQCKVWMRRSWPKSYRKPTYFIDP